MLLAVHHRVLALHRDTFGPLHLTGGKEGESELIAKVMPQDLHRFGMIPELLGRIPVITSTRELGKSVLWICEDAHQILLTKLTGRRNNWNTS